jgi:hypothetical protein
MLSNRSGNENPQVLRLSTFILKDLPILETQFFELIDKINPLLLPSVLKAGKEAVEHRQHARCTFVFILSVFNVSSIGKCD